MHGSGRVVPMGFREHGLCQGYLEGLPAWLLTAYKAPPKHRRPLRPETVQDTLNKMRHLEKCGLDWQAFCHDPALARRLAEPVLAVKAADTSIRGGLRGHQVVVNRVVRFLAARHGQEWLGALWDLAPEAKGRGPMQESLEVKALEEYMGRDDYETALCRAVVWVVRATQYRRGEVAGLWDTDVRLDYCPEYAAMLLRHPEKWGHARPTPLPPAARDPSAPLLVFMRLRRRDRADPRALFTRRDGTTFRALDAQGMTTLLNDMSNRLGFRVSFNRLRRYEFTRMKRSRVDPWVMLYRHGGSSWRTLERYLGDLTPDDVWEDQVAKLPEYQAKPESQGYV